MVSIVLLSVIELESLHIVFNLIGDRVQWKFCHQSAVQMVMKFGWQMLFNKNFIYLFFQILVNISDITYNMIAYVKTG